MKGESEMDKKELENAIREYLKQHASLSVLCYPEEGGYTKVRVGLWLDNEEIANASDVFIQ